MIREEKTYKFLAIAEGWEPVKFSLPPEQLSRLMKIKALRSDSAEKIARQRMERLEERTGCKWTLHREPLELRKRKLRKKQLANAARKPTKLDKVMKLVRLKGEFSFTFWMLGLVEALLLAVSPSRDSVLSGQLPRRECLFGSYGCGYRPSRLGLF